MERGRGLLTELPGARGALVALLLFGLTLSLVLLRYRAPEPLAPGAAGADRIAATRAMSDLDSMLGQRPAPRPIGSEASDRVRGALAERLRTLGYDVRTQRAFACGRYGTCGHVENLIARLEGQSDDAVIVASHYDSVAAGPGVSDDLVGTFALLEVARELRDEPTPRNPVIFLITDGEEAGLLGAEAFFDSYPLREKPAFAVNLEARGTEGPGLMFETSRENRGLIELFARHVERPVTSSAFYTVYKAMPNDTDFTVFKEHGATGVNFAFIGGVSRYHTPLDDLEHASAASLQHLGDGALTMVRALADADPAQLEAGEDAVFFDLLTYATIAWPASWTPLLAALALVLVVAAVALLLRRGLSMRELLWGLLAWLAVLALPAALAAGAWMLFRDKAPWPAHPAFPLVALWSLGFAGLLPPLARRASRAGLWAGAWIGAGLLALALALLVPGMAYPFILPAAAAGLCGIALARFSALGVVAILLPAALLAVLLLPIAVLLYDGIGLLLPPAITALVALTVAPLAPLLTGARPAWSLPAAAVTLAAIGAGITFLVPSYDADSPQRVSLTFHQDADRGRARWIANTGFGSLPQELRSAADFSQVSGPASPWASPGPAAPYVAPADPIAAEPPQLSLLGEEEVAGGRRLRLRLRSPRGAPIGMLLVPADARVRVVSPIERPAAGRVPQPTSRWRLLELSTLPPQGLVLEVTLGSREPVEMIAIDRSRDLPLAGRPLSRARGPAAVPSQAGDVTEVSARYRF